MTYQITVDEILATGLTQAQLASIVPCSQTAISSLRTGLRGKRISKFLGDRLDQIHKERCTPPKKVKGSAGKQHAGPP
jgi:hypothetical protein